MFIIRFAEQDLYVVLGRMLQLFKLEYGPESEDDKNNMGQVCYLRSLPLYDSNVFMYNEQL